LKLTCEVADALESAHQHGVIHRDIKPENILLQNGRPMVADFGIALAVSAAAGGRMTETGLSLGTPHYMSPEQATAEREITARSDQYSLASVLYEMLTGNPPHTGATAQQIIMKIITEQAQDVTALRKSVPRGVADAVAQALEKLPADRFATVAAFASALSGEEGAHGPPRGARATAHRAQLARAAGPWRRLAVVAGVAAIGATAVALWALGQRGAGGGQRVEFTYRPIFELGDRPYTEISNDGQRIVQVVRDTNGVDVIAVRELGSAAMRVLPGTESARDPQITPDGAWIEFQAQGRLQRIPVTGGPATLVADSVNTSGVGVLPNGDVLFTRTGRGMFRATGPGGSEVQLTTLDATRREFAHWYPEALPGGKTVIFNNFSPDGGPRIGARSRDGEAHRPDRGRDLPPLCGERAPPLRARRRDLRRAVRREGRPRPWLPGAGGGGSRLEPDRRSRLLRGLG
jgi:serine/threonine-protein kinase